MFKRVIRGKACRGRVTGGKKTLGRDYEYDTFGTNSRQVFSNSSVIIVKIKREIGQTTCLPASVTPTP